MSLKGKTIARTDEYGDVLYFTDGTAYDASGEYGGQFLDWAAVQGRHHAAQGHRESDRMRRLHDSLHPRDKQWLKQQAKLAEDRYWDTKGADAIISRHFIEEIRKDFNRPATFLFDGLPYQPLKKKHRPIKTYEPGKTYKRKDGSLWHCGGNITIPVKKRKR